MNQNTQRNRNVLDVSTEPILLNSSVNEIKRCTHLASFNFEKHWGVALMTSDEPTAPGNQSSLLLNLTGSAPIPKLVN
jgi:hypothetical protein